jgi:hypothetical protein
LPVGQEKGELAIGNKAIKFVTDKAGSNTYKVISTYEKLYEFVMDKEAAAALVFFTASP